MHGTGDYPVFGGVLVSTQKKIAMIYKSLIDKKSEAGKEDTKVKHSNQRSKKRINSMESFREAET